MYAMFFFFFFFSSRRRHTRSLRDWSSDVCSSDLEKDSGLLLKKAAGFAPLPEKTCLVSGAKCFSMFCISVLALGKGGNFVSDTTGSPINSSIPRLRCGMLREAVNILRELALVRVMS